MRIFFPEKYRILRAKEEPTPEQNSGRNGIG